MTLSQKAFSLLQYPLPHHALSRLTGKFAQCDNPWVKNTLIKAFIKRFDVDMSQALEPDPTAYATFNDFFTRALKADARPLGDGILSPADGTLSQYGRLQAGQLVQAKGHTYSAQTLLGGDTALAEEFLGGSFATVYLSPRDYHRVHMPETGTLREMIYVPGRLFSVNQATANYVPGLFARNERLVCIFDTEHGPMAMTLVGAMIVAAIETVWSGQVTPLAGQPQRMQFGQPITLEKGAEMGRFKLGSTVVMCFAKPVRFEEHPPAKMVSMGESLATF
ncbi:archaetidylserine decarboxylase [Vreelandella boliviensis]|uniref:Phosphatidylserine decarboxylase proenzyme n=1 Tax=Vreelandella boliviensis LC1 TaxID=1072583 RepID=A0A265DXN8_9GAMM|nr:archaetidylserine decarboxylase [Halomonas boliviensis]EHJ91267.1 Phosphatidylserine decarboxylase proenzyme [Halomonas boliviensis LC1]OZT74089.1 phosphatidylserine decarboxylase [Halomonas boliviensis LC1]